MGNREWWLVFGEDGDTYTNHSKEAAEDCVEVCFVQNDIKCESFHVIEHSAYMELKGSLERLMQERQFETKAFHELKAEAEKLAEALSCYVDERLDTVLSEGSVAEKALASWKNYLENK